MRYYKTIIDGYIKTVGDGNIGEEITQTEYDNIISIITARPTLPEGKGLRLKSNLTWEEYEVPEPEEDENIDPTEIAEALEEIL